MCTPLMNMERSNSITQLVLPKIESFFETKRAICRVCGGNFKSELERPVFIRGALL